MSEPTAPLDYRAPAADAAAGGPPGSMRRDIGWAYAATGSRLASWALVSAVVYRADAAAFALLALVRATLGLLNYTSLGLAPGMIRLLTAGPRVSTLRIDDELTPSSGTPGEGGGEGSRAGREAFEVLRRPREDPHPNPLPEYRERDQDRPPAGGGLDPDAVSPALLPYANGVAVALLTGTVGVALTVAYALLFDRLHRLPPGAFTPTWLVLGMGLGTVLRLMSDAPAAILQTHGQIAADNKLLVTAEAAWAAVAGFGWSLAPTGDRLLDFVGVGFTLSGLMLLLMRLGLAAPITGQLVPEWGLVSARVVRRLLAFGSLVTVAQLADYLYAPTDYILINRLITPPAAAVTALAAYAPAVQIDAGLLLTVGGLSAVLLPRTALAHAAGNRDVVRRYYVRGTLASLVLLLAAAVAIWLVSRPLLRLWLGSDVPQTRAILPLVLVHTVVGGSSGVGRAVLLAMGKVKPFTASVLVAGAVNVMLSYSFVRFFGWGLRGIILGTIVAVVGRCAVWTPWYVLRVLRREGASGGATT